MKQVTAFALGFGVFVGAAVSAHASINIKVAEVQNGVAVVQGSKAVPNAVIFWEGTKVTQANKGGNFSFSGVVPADCVGTLSDGAPIEVTLLNCTPVAEAPAPVARTGQTTRYVSGDDGDLQKGVILPKPRFTDNSNGTIRDNLTGLLWLKDAHCGNNSNTWQGALDFVAAINAGTQNCGDISNGGTHQNDWRLPNVRELHSLVDYGTSNPALTKDFQAYPVNGYPFLNFSALSYWSSTTHVANTLNAWTVDFNEGYVGNSTTQAGRFVKTDTNNVIAVRGGFLASAK
jgi:hypothetical protein